jgi:hypothetical protein
MESILRRAVAVPVDIGRSALGADFFFNTPV